MFAVLAANGVLGAPSPSPAAPSIPLPTMSPPSSSLYGAYGPTNTMGKPRVQQQQQPMMRSDRPSLGLNPSLWMTPAAPSTNYNVVSSNSNSQRSGASSNSNSLRTGGSSVGTSLFPDLFNDDIFSNAGSTSTGLTSMHPRQSQQPVSPTLSPQIAPFSPEIVNSPILNHSEGSSETTEDVSSLAKEDPLATQVWKMYAKTKANLPNQQRMENLTWRMMALALKKKERDEKEKEKEDKFKQESKEKAKREHEKEFGRSTSSEDQKPQQQLDDAGVGERGRRIDKGKPRVRVVGFDGTNLDGEASDVVDMDWRAMSRSRSRISMDWRPTSRSRSRPPETTTSFDQNMSGMYGNDMHMGYGGMGYSNVNLGAGGYGAGGGFGGMGMGGFPASAPNPSTGFDELEAAQQQPGAPPMGRMGVPVGMGRRSPAGSYQMQQQQFAGMSQYHQHNELGVLYESSGYEVNEDGSGSVFENGESRYAGMRTYDDDYSGSAPAGLQPPRQEDQLRPHRRHEG
ncbi:hypothetical protein NMY22_g18906 [Coprinellus aureogranulatus]|nr:hypothetical protein NMY22_g18906 [Coprinellus aureogranulatus]